MTAKEIHRATLFQCQCRSFLCLGFAGIADHPGPICHGTFLDPNLHYVCTGRKRWKDIVVYLLNCKEPIVEKILVLTVTRRQKKSIYITRFAVMVGTGDPHTAGGLCFPETGGVAVLLLQEKTVFRYCKYNHENGLNGSLHGALL